MESRKPEISNIAAFFKMFSGKKSQKYQCLEFHGRMKAGSATMSFRT
jgi:hypothetical protein